MKEYFEPFRLLKTVGKIIFTIPPQIWYPALKNFHWNCWIKNPDIFLITNESMADLDNFPDPEVPAEKIIENLEAESFKKILESFNDR